MYIPVFRRISTVSHTVCSLLQFVVADSSSSSGFQSVLRHVQTFHSLTTSIAVYISRIASQRNINNHKGDRELSGPRTCFTQFTTLNGKPPTWLCVVPGKIDKSSSNILKPDEVPVRLPAGSHCGLPCFPCAEVPRNGCVLPFRTRALHHGGRMYFVFFSANFFFFLKHCGD